MTVKQFFIVVLLDALICFCDIWLSFAMPPLTPPHSSFPSPHSPRTKYSTPYNTRPSSLIGRPENDASSSSSLSVKNNRNNQQQLQGATKPQQHQYPPRKAMPTSIIELLQYQGGLVNIPQAVLQQCIEPVMQALADLDAMALLHLEECSPDESGPRISDGYVTEELIISLFDCWISQAILIVE
jgi:hypothetical protein